MDIIENEAAKIASSHFRDDCAESVLMAEVWHKEKRPDITVFGAGIVRRGPVCGALPEG